MIRPICMLMTLALIAGLPVHAATATCDETVRQQFAADVEAGLGQDELEAKYGFCRNDGASAATTSGLSAKSIIITNNGSTSYEQMDGCGYHPQGETLACNVQIKLPFGFGGATGTSEHVLFCMDCDNNGTWDYATLGSVHVTDDFSGGIPSWYFNVTASTWAAPNSAGRNCTANDGLVTRVQAKLSWVLRPDPVTLSSCSTFAPFWGNTITFDARRDP